VVTTDLFFTVLEAAGVTPPADAVRDGVSLASLQKDPSSKLDRDALYFHFPHYYWNTSPVSAIRQGPWKLIEFYETGNRELYNLADDLSEGHDLAAEMPDELARLTDRLHAWRDDVGARLPQPNPDYKPPKKKGQ
ncbi:MAG TPA: sulfatase/phosphatase domain-containing protein, partial [Pirellulales bacterium]|nr:sulfatase/phosphatase domain-containing protein [Pirellulales bacterium]